MTKRSKNATNAPVEAKEKKNVWCVDCEHSLLHRYGCNPVLSACRKKPNMTGLNIEKFPYGVEVAAIRRNCNDYAYTAQVKEIEQRKAS